MQSELFNSLLPGATRLSMLVCLSSRGPTGVYMAAILLASLTPLR